MLIAYDTKLRLPPGQHTTEPELSLSQGPGSGLISLNTKNFRVEYREGQAEMYLSRSLTPAQLRQFAEIAMSMANDLDRQNEMYVMSSQTIPLPPGIQFTTVAQAKSLDDQDCD